MSQMDQPPPNLSTAGLGKGQTMGDFLKFKRMITPVIIQILFWVGVVACVILGLVTMVVGVASERGGGGQVISGLLMILLGPIVVRVYCEVLIVVFAINNTLTEMKNIMKSRPM